MSVVLPYCSTLDTKKSKDTTLTVCSIILECG